MFFMNPYNIIDTASVLPVVLRLALQFWVVDEARAARYVILLGYAPVLRLLKLLRNFKTYHLIMEAFVLSLEALPVLLYIYLLLLLLFSALLFSFERRDNVPTLGESIWLTGVSMTTLGYGDKTPKTTLGRGVIVVLVVTSALYMAIPIGILGQCFSEVWRDRDRLELVRRVRNRFIEHGYTPEACLNIFATFDTDKSGNLTLDEFRKMTEQLKLNLKEERVIKLFEHMGTEGKEVGEREFVRFVFP